MYFSVNIPYIVSGIMNFSTEMFWGYSVTWFMMHFKGLGYYLSMMHLEYVDFCYYLIDTFICYGLLLFYDALGKAPAPRHRS